MTNELITYRLPIDYWLFMTLAELTKPEVMSQTRLVNHITQLELLYSIH